MFRKIAVLQTLEAYRVPAHADVATLSRAAHRVNFNYTPRPGYLYVRSRAISSRCNDNYDEFPAEEIAKSFRTFIGKPVFVNHRNEDHKRMRGVVIDAALHRDTNPDGTPDTWAEVLMEVDAKTFPKLAKAILAGEVDRTSMGCDVQLSVCSACGNKATNPAEYCQHIPAMKGQRIFRANASTGRREGHLVREICYGLGFFENSLLVEEPADPTAYFLGVDDRGMKMTASRKTASASADDDNLFELGGTHHAACGRFLPGRRQAVKIIEERLHHPGDPAFEPVKNITEGARAYNQSVGLDDPHAESYHDVETHPDRVRALAQLYDKLPMNDPGAHAAFHEMRRQVNHQYDHLTNKMGVKVETVDHDPYADVHEMAHDLRQNKRLQVLSTQATGPHGFFDDETNDKFRAVHDAFGHAATGRSFDRHGEEAAWLAHSRMFHGKARHAMTTETRGQNSMLIATGKFPPQKTALLPARFLQRHAGSTTAVSDEEIWKGLGLPKAEDTHREVVRDKAKDAADALMKPFYEPYGGEENYHLHRNNESMMDLHRRYESGEAKGGKFGFDDEDEGGEPYYEIHHHSPQGKKTGWSIRHYSDGPNAEIRHDATPGEGHEMFDIGENTYGSDSPGLGGRVRPPEQFGHEHLHKLLNAWHGDEEGGGREHLEGPYGDPRIRRYKRRYGTLETEAASRPKYENPADHPFFKEHPSHPDNIVGAWHRATEGQRAQGMRWYSDAHHIAKAIAEGDAAKGAGVLAAYSPKASWPSNMFNASRSLREGRALGKGEGDSIMGMHQRLAQRMIGDDEHPAEHHSKVLKSPKISDFAHLIEHGGDEDPDHHTRVVVDRHAMSVATGHRMTTKDLEDAPLGSRHYYEHPANHFRQAAASISEHEGQRVAPHQVQAVTWLVQQHENVAHDLAMPGPGGRGRQTRDKNVWTRWQEHAPEHVADPNEGNIHLLSPHEIHRQKASYLTAGLNDVVAPPQVDTLRDEECPVCGETDVYDGERCPVCGFVAPPEMFRDPDLEMAKQLDLRQDQTLPEQAPGQANPDEPGGGLIDPSQLGESSTADQLQHPDQLNPNGVPGEPGTPGDGVPDLFCPACGEGVDAGQPLSTDQDPATMDATGPTEGMPCPNCGQATLLSAGDMEAMGEQPMASGEGDEEGALPPDQQADQQQDEAEAPQEGEGPPVDQETDDEPDDDEDSGAPPVDEEDRPSKKRDQNSKGATRMGKSVEAALAANTAAVDALMRELRIQGAQNALLAKVAGLEDQFAAIRRQADIDNPAQPVPDPGEEQAPESTEQAVTPEAADDPQRPGQTPNAVQGVPAEQVDTPLRPGVTMPTAPANQLVDVTAPVAGTNTGEVPLEQRRIETDVRVGDPMAGAGSDQAKAFPWTMGSKEGQALASNRTMASMRLAELRIHAGLAPASDKYGVAAAIETDGNFSDASLAHEIRTLEAVGRTAAKQQRPAGLVPRAAADARTAPSLAPQLATVGADGGYDDTSDSDLFM